MLYKYWKYKKKTKKHLNPKCLCVVCPLLKTMLPGVLATSSERATGDTLRETHETVQVTNDMRHNFFGHFVRFRVM